MVPNWSITINRLITEPLLVNPGLGGLGMHLAPAQHVSRRGREGASPDPVEAPGVPNPHLCLGCRRHMECPHHGQAGAQCHEHLAVEQV